MMLRPDVGNAIDLERRMNFADSHTHT
jgi:hypothetical protein